MLNTGFEKVLLMQNPLNLRASEVIDTYVYKVGLVSQAANFSYATAIGLFKSVISLILLISVNKAAQKLGGSEEHTSELQSLMRISYAVVCLQKQKKNTT